VHALGNIPEESGSNLLVGRILGQVDRNQKLLSLCIDITNINTTLVGKEDPITL